MQLMLGSLGLGVYLSMFYKEAIRARQWSKILQGTIGYLCTDVLLSALARGIYLMAITMIDFLRGEAITLNRRGGYPFLAIVLVIAEILPSFEDILRFFIRL